MDSDAHLLVEGICCLVGRLLLLYQRRGPIIVFCRGIVEVHLRVVQESRGQSVVVVFVFVVGKELVR